MKEDVMLNEVDEASDNGRPGSLKAIRESIIP